MTNILHGAWNGVCSTARFAKNSVDTAASTTNWAIDSVAGDKGLKAAKIAGIVTAVALGAIALTALVVIGAVYLGPGALLLGGKAVALLSPLVAAAWAACAPVLAVAASATGSAIAAAASATSAFVTSVSVATALQVTFAVAASAALIGYLSSRNVDKAKLFVGQINHAYCEKSYNSNVKNLNKALEKYDIATKEQPLLPATVESEEDQALRDASNKKIAEAQANYSKACDKVGHAERKLNLLEGKLNELNRKLGRTVLYSPRDILATKDSDDKLVYPVLS